MSRSKNIITGKKSGPIEAGLFKEKYEEELYNALLLAEKESAGLLKDKKYDKLLEVLERLGKTVDLFFDEVLVMDKDVKVKDNRINLLKKVTDLYMGLADFSLIVIENSMK